MSLVCCVFHMLFVIHYIWPFFVFFQRKIFPVVYCAVQFRKLWGIQTVFLCHVATQSSFVFSAVEL